MAAAKIFFSVFYKSKICRFNNVFFLFSYFLPFFLVIHLLAFGLLPFKAFFFLVLG